MTDLAPCPFCGSGTTRIDESNHWTGMRSVVISASVMHWCGRAEGQLQSRLELKGKTRDEAVQAWNTRQGGELFLLRRCLAIVQADADMMATISRHAPLDPESQARHDSTEYDSERLAAEISEYLQRSES